MGRYDTFMGCYKCKSCAASFEFNEQTKDFECMYEDSIAAGTEFNDSDNPNHYFVRNFCILKRLE